MNILSELTAQLKRHNLLPAAFKDQHFCIDKAVFDTLLQQAQLSRRDIVMEIGTGTGMLTKELAKHAGKVITIELDRSLEPIIRDYLRVYSDDVEIIFGNALNIRPARKDFNKIISNLPYQLCEPLLQYLTAAKQIERVVITVPQTFAQKAQQHPIFSAFFNINIIKDVPKEAFFPPPKVLSAIITITPIQNPTDAQFLIQKLHLQRDKKLRNGLRDALIDVYQRRNKKLTKKQALEMIKKFHFSEKTSDTLIAKLPLEVYEWIKVKINKNSF